MQSLSEHEKFITKLASGLCNRLWLGVGSTRLCVHENACELRATSLIVRVESARGWAIQVQHTDKSVSVEQRDHQFRSRVWITRNVIGELLDIANDNWRFLERSGPANASAQINADASRFPLEWSEN